MALQALIAAMLEFAGTDSPRVRKLAERLAPVILSETGRVGPVGPRETVGGSDGPQAGFAGAPPISPIVIIGVAFRESGYRPNLVGARGELGVMQVAPEWARKWPCYGLKLARLRDGVRCGVRLLARGLALCGSIESALTWYGSGRCGTSAYSRRVMALVAIGQ